MKKHSFIKVLLISLILLLSNSSFAFTPIFLDKKTGKYPLGPNIEILEDKKGTLSIKDVTSPEYNRKFADTKEEVPNYGYTDSAYWVRATLKNQTIEPGTWYIELGYANMHYIDFYKLSKEGKKLAERKTGLLRPSEHRPNQYHLYLFDVHLAKGQSTTCYFRFKTETSMTLPLTLWSAEGFQIKKAKESLYFGAFYGIILIMLIYNLLLFISLKSKDYFHYVLFLIFFIFFQLAFGGLGPTYIWSSFPELNYYATNTFQAGMLIFLLWFTISFLEIKIFSQVAYKIFIFIFIVWVIILAIIPFVSYSFITAKADIWMYVSFLAAAVTGAFALFRGYNPSRYFLIAWTGMIAGAFIMSSVRFHLFPSNVLTEHSHQIGLIWLIVFWSLALADRMNNLKEKFKTSNISLQKEKDLNNRLFENSPAFIVAIDLSWNIIMINDIMCRKLGYNREDVIGKNYFNQFMPGQQKSNFKTMVNLFMNSEKKKTESKNFIESKDGKKYLVEWHGSFISPQGNEEGFIIGIGIDITERTQVELQLLQAQKMETIGNLAGGIAHDFNNILSGIMGPISIIENNLQKNGKIATEILQKYLAIMSGSSERASDMIRQLMLITQKQELNFSPIDLNSAIKNVMVICASTLDKSIKLNTEYFSNPVIVNADPAQIEQVLLNFCINAGHAMTIMRSQTEKWGGTLTVSVEPAQKDTFLQQTHPEAKNNNYWRLSVNDTGIGIKKEILPKIFDPFFTTKIDGKGTGLGLSMVYNIIKQHDGFINVYSETGEGTTFSIYLPVLEDITVREPDKDKKTIPRGEGKILVVDDEEVIRITSRDILESCGYEVILAETGMEALDIYKTYHKDIKCVLLDMSMPEMSGKEVHIEMKKINPGIKTLLVSGFRQDERVKEALKLGVKSFVQKPYTLEELSSKVYEVIKNP